MYSTISDVQVNLKFLGGITMDIVVLILLSVAIVLLIWLVVKRNGVESNLTEISQELALLRADLTQELLTIYLPVSGTLGQQSLTFANRLLKDSRESSRYFELVKLRDILQTFFWLLINRVGETQRMPFEAAMDKVLDGALLVKERSHTVDGMCDKVFNDVRVGKGEYLFRGMLKIIYTELDEDELKQEQEIFIDILGVLSRGTFIEGE